MFYYLYFYSEMDTNILFLGGTKLLQKIAKDIDLAQEKIYIQMYIIADDYVGNSIKKALIRAASRGVLVYVVADAYGSLELPHHFITELKKNGIHFRFFNHFIKRLSLSFGRRLHHKIITIDSSIAYVGGINLSDNYFLKTPWLDFMVRSVEKKMVSDLVRICEDVYTKDFFQKRKTCRKILVNDFAKKKTEITKTYYQLINEAKYDIVLIAAYFLPSINFRKALRQATERGVKITFITGKQSDVKTVKYAMEFLYLWMQKKDITLLEYQPSIVHGKLLITDNSFLTVGSYNLNKLSDHASIELNLLLNNTQDFLLFSQFQTYYKEIILPQTKSISLHYTHDLPFWKKIRNAISYQIVRWGLSVLTFFNKSEKVQRHFQ